MKLLKKSATVLLICALSITMFTACAKKPEGTGTGTGTSSGTSAGTSDSGSSAGSDESSNENNDDDEITVTPTTLPLDDSTKAAAAKALGDDVKYDDTTLEAQAKTTLKNFCDFTQAVANGSMTQAEAEEKIEQTKKMLTTQKELLVISSSDTPVTESEIIKALSELKLENGIFKVTKVGIAKSEITTSSPDGDKTSYAYAAVVELGVNTVDADDTNKQAIKANLNATYNGELDTEAEAFVNYVADMIATNIDDYATKDKDAIADSLEAYYENYNKKLESNHMKLICATDASQIALTSGVTASEFGFITVPLDTETNLIVCVVKNA